MIKRFLPGTLVAVLLACAPAEAASGQWPCERRIARAHAAAAITDQQRDEYRAAVAAAKRARAALTRGGVRRRELGGTITIVNRLAERGVLTASRMPAVFLTLQRNAEYWRSHDPPRRPPPVGQCAAGVGYSLPRVTFGDDPITFQHYPGNGLQIQWLGNFGKANALAAQCLAPTPKAPCRPDKLKALLDRLVALRSQRGDGFTAWEYTFPFGGGAPPWVSGMAQATALQALARGSRALSDPSYLEVARGALGAFRAGPPAGTRVASGDGSHYLIYSFGGLRVLNAFLQSLIGLYDYATISGDAEAMELFRSGDRAARREVPRYDTGAWSRYSLGGGEANLEYHKLVRDFLQRLCDRTRADVYCGTAARFSSYLEQPPALAFEPSPQARRRRPATVRVRISKIACVKVAVWRGTRVVRVARYVFAAGRRSFVFVPPARGRYRVAVDARDLAGNRAVIRRSLTAR